MKVFFSQHDICILCENRKPSHQFGVCLFVFNVLYIYNVSWLWRPSGYFGKNLQVRSLTLVFMSHVNSEQWTVRLRLANPSSSYLCRHRQFCGDPTDCPEWTADRTGPRLQCLRQPKLPWKEYWPFCRFACPSFKLCQTPSWQEQPPRSAVPDAISSDLCCIRLTTAALQPNIRTPQGGLCYDKLHAGKNLFSKYLWCVQELTKEDAALTSSRIQSQVASFF